MNRLPLDDQQQARHAMGQMAEQSRILYDELLVAGFESDMAEKMVLIWWRNLIASALTPDFADIIKSIFPKEE